MTSLQTKIDAADASSAAAGTEEAAAEEQATVRVTTTDTVKVRATPDTNGEQLGTAAKGDSFTRLSEENGWSKVQYKDGEAYISSDFLTTAQGDTVVAGQIAGDEAAANTANTETQQETNTAAEQPANTDNSSSSTGKKVQVSEPISVRSAASTESNKIGSAYAGDSYKITGEDGDWYKIDYKGSTGYVRKDLVTVK